MQDFSKLYDVFSPVLLGYILNLNKDQLNAIQSTHDIRLNAAQQSALIVLDDFIKKIRNKQYQDGRNILISAQIVKHFLSEFRNQLTLQQLRLSCGGSLYTHIISGDKLKDFFGSRINNIFIKLLTNDTPTFFTDPMEEELLQIIHNDAIAKLITDSHSAKYISTVLCDANQISIGYVHESICVMMDSMLQSCYKNCIYRLNISEVSLLKEIYHAIDFLRDIALNRKTAIPIFLGLYGVGFYGFDKLELDDLVLNNIARNDLTNSLSSSTVCVWANNPEAKFYGLSVESAIPIISKSNIPHNSNRPFFHDYKMIEEIKHKTENFYLALLFKKNTSSVFATSFARCGYYFDPSLEYNDNLCSSNTKLIQIKKEDIPEIKKWYAIFQNNKSISLNNALENIKNSIMCQNSIMDSIMSGFYAWESMFTNRINTTKAVVNSISAYSGCDSKEIDYLYDKYRSYKSHGKQFYKSDVATLYTIHKKVTDIAIFCIKKLFEDEYLKELRPSKRVKALSTLK